MALQHREAYPSAYAEIVLSHLRDIFARLATTTTHPYPLRYCEHYNRKPHTIVRLCHSASAADLVAPDVTVTPHGQPGMYVVSPARPAVLAEWATRGLAQVQDPTPARAVEHLQVEPGQTVLDRCSGLG